MAFLEDPRLRQRWNQITHDAETVTENAAAGIWSFQHNYIYPCLGSIIASIDQCTTVCLGDPEERIRRQRERARERAEYSFNFYDDWDREDENGGLLGTWGGEDWERLLVGSGSQKRTETIEQPRKKKGMNYGTRGIRRKGSELDPTIIPSTQPIGFLSRLPWRMGGPLRYKPSAADLQDHPGMRSHHVAETQPLLGSEYESDEENFRVSPTRKRSGTTGSGDTSDSYRSRGDLFPSDGEGEEDAVPLDDEVTYDMIRKDDRSTKSGRTPSSKGKRPADGFAVSRTVSRTTLGSYTSRDSSRPRRRRSSPGPDTSDIDTAHSIKDAGLTEVSDNEDEDEELAGKRQAAAQMVISEIAQTLASTGSVNEPKPPELPDNDNKRHHQEPYEVRLYEDIARNDNNPRSRKLDQRVPSTHDKGRIIDDEDFVGARLPNFT